MEIWPLTHQSYSPCVIRAFYTPNRPEGAKQACRWIKIATFVFAVYPLHPKAHPEPRAATDARLRVVRGLYVLQTIAAGFLGNLVTNILVIMKVNTIIAFLLSIYLGIAVACSPVSPVNPSEQTETGDGSGDEGGAAHTAKIRVDINPATGFPSKGHLDLILDNFVFLND